MEQKILRIKTKNQKQKQQLDDQISNGWRVKSSESYSQGYSCNKTRCLAVVFLPLALLGKKPDVVEYILEKETKYKKQKK